MFGVAFLSKGYGSSFSWRRFVSSLNVHLFARAVSFVVFFFFSACSLFREGLGDFNVEDILVQFAVLLLWRRNRSLCLHFGFGAELFSRRWFLAWFVPFESLLWSLFFPFPFASCLMLHTLSSFSVSSFNTDFFAFSVGGQRRGNWESFSQIFVVIVCVPSSLSHGKFTRIQKGMHS